jgi:diguanylate cyclase
MNSPLPIPVTEPAAASGLPLPMMAQYLQTREESVTLLRLVIAEMSLHDAPFNPATFAVFYEHLAGINPRLTEAVLQAKKLETRLKALTLARLFRDHVAPPDELTTDTVRKDFQRVMDEVAESASRTGKTARAYGSQLADLSKALEAQDAGAPSASLSPQLSEVAGGTAHMQAVVASLEQSVAHGHEQIQQLREALERSRMEAVTDALSHLRNRKGFDEALREALAAPPVNGLTTCLIILDIDHFKRVNDTHGHPVGDTVIETLGQTLARVANGPNVLAARIGGEEFAVLLRASTALQAKQLAEVICSLVRTLKIKKRGTQEVIASITVSAGVAARMPGDDGASLLAAADAALYRAKQSGRNQVVVA